jgi:hypothetical protein
VNNSKLVTHTASFCWPAEHGEQDVYLCGDFTGVGRRRPPAAPLALLHACAGGSPAGGSTHTHPLRRCGAADACAGPEGALADDPPPHARTHATP